MTRYLETRIERLPDDRGNDCLIDWLVIYRRRGGRLRVVYSVPVRELPEDPRAAQELDELATWLARQAGIDTSNGYATWWRGNGGALDLEGEYDGPVLVEPFAEGERWTAILLPASCQKKDGWVTPLHPEAARRANAWRRDQM